MSTLVPVDGRAFWTGLNAAIPADWLRDTDYDDRYLQGGAVGFTVAANAGAATHDHTADAHGLTGNSHTHSVTGLAVAADDTPVTDGGQFGAIRIVIESEVNLHAHGSTPSSPTTIAYQNATPAISTAVAAPLTIRAIVIKPDTTEQDIPDDAICFTDEPAAPTGFSITNGDGTTDDLDGYFIRAPDLGNDGDVTGEGAADHTHTSVHTHAIVGHLHASAPSGTANPTWGATSGAQDVATLTHHLVPLTIIGQSDLSSDDGNIDAVSNDPAYVELLGIQNTSGAPTTPEGVIIGYVGAEADIEIGWELVSSTTDRQIKITTTVGDIGNTSGSDTHTHPTSNHNHTHTGPHDHPATGPMAGSATRGTGGSTVDAVLKTPKHTHTWSVVGTTSTTQNNTFTMSTDDIRLLYRTMIFIKRVPWTTVHIKGGRILGGAIL